MEDALSVFVRVIQVPAYVVAPCFQAGIDIAQSVKLRVVQSSLMALYPALSQIVEPHLMVRGHFFFFCFRPFFDLPAFFEEGFICRISHLIALPGGILSSIVFGKVFMASCAEAIAIFA